MQKCAAITVMLCSFQVTYDDKEHLLQTTTTKNQQNLEVIHIIQSTFYQQKID